MTVATTRPETLLGDTAVAVHSQDARWNWAIGLHVELPLTGRLIRIIADDILVDPAFGSGVVKVTPAHDPNDYAVWQRHQNQPDAIDIINLMNPDGTLNAAAGVYAGLTMSAARKKVVADLGDALVKEEPYETQVGHSDRSKTAIQPYLSDQWFVKMAPLADPALDVVRDGTIKFFPERHAQQYLSWLGEKRDWPISRQLWWGHRIPVWSGETHYDVNHALAGTEEHMADFEKKFADSLSGYAESLNASHSIAVSFSRQPFFGPTHFHICLLDASGEAALSEFAGFQRALHGLMQTRENGLKPVPRFDSLTGISRQAAYALDKYVRFVDKQDPDVLDTWFSSALWPHSTLGWPDRASADLAKWYPTSVLMTGRDIITLWVARMVMMGMYNMGASSAHSAAEKARAVGNADSRETPPPLPPGEGRGEGRSVNDASAADVSSSSSPHPNPLPEGEGTRGRLAQLGIPFPHVSINPTILDGRGERMSKSKGNGVDPVDIIDTHGADALRFTLTTMATETQDVRLPVKKDAQGRNTSDRFDLGRNFATKLWNAARFALSNLAPSPGTPGEGGGEGDLERRGGTDVQNHPHPTVPELKEDRARGPESLVDRWIVSRFNKAVADADAALAIYRFDQYATACYDFFWRDLCDWYLETIKPAMKTGDVETANTLAAILDGTLRLLHPMIPFITERLWWELNRVRPTRGIAGLKCAFSERLIKAAWPTPGEIDAAAEADFAALQQIVTAIRNVRSEHNVDAKKTVPVIATGPAEALGLIAKNIEWLQPLATYTLTTEGAAPADAVRAVAGAVELFIHGVTDPAAEAQRKAKQCESLTKQAAALRGRLANPSYADKAPPHLVQQTKNELANVEGELAKLGC